jgi:hypothetical protein
MPKARMICLANSRKFNGRCVAGLAWDGRDYSVWMRPVCGHGSGELEHERFYKGEREPQLLDVIEFEYLSERPRGCHAEDVVVDSSKIWKKVDTYSYAAALLLAEASKPPLWVDGESSRAGENDAIEAEKAKWLRSSLRLVAPAFVVLKATVEEPRSRKKVRGEFRLGLRRYILSVTDPRIEKEFLDLEPGTTRVVRRPLLSISISERFEYTNAHYKLIAGVMEA